MTARAAVGSVLLTRVTDDGQEAEGGLTNVGNASANVYCRGAWPVVPVPVVPVPVVPVPGLPAPVVPVRRS